MLVALALGIALLGIGSWHVSRLFDDAKDLPAIENKISEWQMYYDYQRRLIGRKIPVQEYAAKVRPIMDYSKSQYELELERDKLRVARARAGTALSDLSFWVVAYIVAALFAVIGSAQLFKARVNQALEDQIAALTRAGDAAHTRYLRPSNMPASPPPLPQVAAS